MTDAQLWSWIVTIVGVVGFFLAGKKLWWAWYWGLGTQVLWTVYAIVSNQPAFFVSVLLYSFVYGKNAWSWTKEHLEQKARKENLQELLKRRGPHLHFPSARLTQRFGTFEPSPHSGTSFPPDVDGGIYSDVDMRTQNQKRRDLGMTEAAVPDSRGDVRQERNPPNKTGLQESTMCYAYHPGKTCNEHDFNK